MNRSIVFILCLVAATSMACVESAPNSANNVSDGGTVADAGSESDMDGTADAGMTGADADVDMGPPTFSPSREASRTLDGLLAYYPFRQTDSIADEVGNRNRALPDGATITDGALNLPPSPFELISPAELAGAVTDSQEFTLEFWVDTDQGFQGPIIRWNQLVVSKATGAAGFAGLCIYDCFSEDAREVESTFFLGTMQHIVVTGNAAVTRLYVNGLLVGAWHASSVELNALFVGVPEVRIGSDSAEYRFGLIALYDRQLSPGEVFSHTIVGPNPTPAQESAAPDDRAFSVGSDGVLHDGAQRAITVAMDAKRDDLRLMDGRVGLLYLEHPVPSDAELLASRLYLYSFPASAGSNGAFQLSEVLREWNTEASWSETGTGEMWESDGLGGANDLSDTIFEQGIGTDDVLIAEVPVGEHVWAWQKEMRANNGFAGTCFNCTITIPNEKEYAVARRPRLVSLLQADPPNAVPAKPSDTMQQAVDNNLFVQWADQASGVIHEVYVGGRLVKRTDKTFIEIPWDTTIDPPPIIVIAVDPWGRESAPETAF